MCKINVYGSSYLSDDELSLLWIFYYGAIYLQILYV